MDVEGSYSKKNNTIGWGGGREREREREREYIKGKERKEGGEMGDDNEEVW